MKKSFFKKLTQKLFFRTFVSYVGIIALVLILTFLFSQATIRQYYIDNVETHLHQIGRSLEPKFKELYEKGDSVELDRLAKEVGKKIDIRITVIAPDGVVMADSQNDPKHMENHGDRPEILQALKSEIPEASATRFSATMGEQMLYLAMAVEERGEPLFVIRVSLYLSEIRHLIGELKWKFAGALLVLFLVALSVAWYFSRGISKPVQEIAEATREFASGNFDVKIFLKKKDELAEVAESFNHMVGQQKSLFDKLSQNRAELTAIISSMKEGLMVLDTDGKITLCNESLEEIAGKKKLTGHAYWEVLRIPGFDEFVKKAFQAKEVNEEVALENKNYLVGFNHMKEEKKLVIIFRDITGFKQLEQMKKDFVVNLTHELKTPLTAIKGFVETLEEEEDIKNTQYIEIIKRHTDRMNQIVSDMLVLSELEENLREVVFESLDLETTVQNILKIYGDKIKEKNVELDVNIEKNLPPLKGERFKIEQMLINLVDNAMKYTDKGKISIAVGATDDGKHIEIRVMNTGVPIPEKSLPRLFERFYVVDKSRSRKLGGTGLGLSIVKHVVLLHRGEIFVKSSKRDGTIFTILLPLT